MSQAISIKQRRLRSWTEVACSFVLTSCAAYVALGYLYKSFLHNDLAYYFRRASVHLCDLLGLAATNAVSIATVARDDEGAGRPWGEGLTVVISVLAVTAIVVLLRCARRISDRRFRHLPWLISLFVPGVCCLIVSTFPLSWWELQPSGISTSQTTAALTAQIAGVAALGLLRRFRPVPFWLIASCSAIVYAFWIWESWAATRGWHPDPTVIRALLCGSDFRRTLSG